ncbi:MAG: Rieske 2Fe-2S domain-containing protein [Ideonella sp.]
MADAPAGAIWLCRSEQLIELGQAILFEVRQFGVPVRAFALRHDGHLLAYLNRCAHVPVEMDWLPGEFLDSERDYIICSIHGATYRPRDGACVGGPCGRGRLTALVVAEVADQVYWYPSTEIRPALPVTESLP